MTKAYTLEIRDQGGALLHVLPEVAGTWTQVVNGVNHMQLRVPRREWNAHVLDALEAPNQVWIYDRRGDLVDRQHILPQDRTRNPDAEFYEVRCEGLESQLRHETLIEYDEEKTVQQHLTAWFDVEQVADSPITLGTVDANVGDLVRRARHEATGMLSAIRRLHDSVGGFWWVDAQSGEFQWRDEMVAPTGQRLTVGHNLARLKRRRDPSYLVTRLYMFGRRPHARRLLRLSEAEGQTLDYLEGRATSIAKWGTRVRRVVEYSINDAETLLERAKREMDGLDTPRLVMEAEAADLDALGDAFADHALQLGALVTVVDPALGIEEEAYIGEIERDLAKPLSGARIRFRQAAEPNHVDPDDPVNLQPPDEDLVDTVSFNRERGELLGIEDNDLGQDVEFEGWVNDRITAELEPGGAIEQGIADQLEGNAEGAMSDLPFVARLFVGNDLAAINDMAGSVAYPNLAFQNDQDFALTTDDPENVLHVRQAGAWVEVTSPEPFVFHGADATVARPGNVTTVVWIGEAEPDNKVEDDLWLEEF